uniref:G protein-coupled receptor n=1 Tax=Pristionchus pacificus TaxID=54126 RepID=A0A2A6CQX9_PRIPA|eukprot:PDM80622.1 G protein-coupled receptor [Pristionchus pacificus]
MRRSVMIPQLILGWNFPHYEFYNCSSVHPPGDWWRTIFGKQDYFFGAWSIAYGILMELIYIPCIIVLFPERKNTCYAIMLTLGFIDMLSIACNSIMFGFFMLEGAVFCSRPVLIWITGALALGAWCAGCMACFLLITNRIFELLNWNSHRTARPWIFQLVIAIYFCFFAVFTPPVLASSTHRAMFFDPFIDMHWDNFYVNWLHTANNFLIVLLSALLYAVFCAALRFRQSSMSSDVSNAVVTANRSIFMQASIICGLDVIASLIYVYMNFFDSPPELRQIGQVAWQLSHGAPPVIYLTLNRTIRNGVKKLFTLPNKVKTSGGPIP